MALSFDLDSMDDGDSEMIFMSPSADPSNAPQDHEQEDSMYDSPHSHFATDRFEASPRDHATANLPTARSTQVMSPTSERTYALLDQCNQTLKDNQEALDALRSENGSLRKSLMEANAFVKLGASRRTLDFSSSDVEGEEEQEAFGPASSDAGADKKNQGTYGPASSDAGADAQKKSKAGASSSDDAADPGFVRRLLVVRQLQRS